MGSRVAVIGAGEMGHGIAERAALHGYEVCLRDIRKELLDRGMERIRWSLGKLVEKAQIRKEQADEALVRVRPVLSLQEAVRNADIVIEAVFEDLELKKRIFGEAQYGPDSHEGFVRLFLSYLGLFHEFPQGPPDPLHSAVEEFFPDVPQADLVAVESRELRDSVAHFTGA